MNAEEVIKEAAREIVSSGRLIETESVESEAFDAGDANALVSGDVNGGANIRGKESLVVEGSLIGKPNEPCQVEFRGDVVVKGRVEHASIIGRKIQIGGEGKNCRLTAQKDIEIGSTLTNSRTLSGDFTPINNSYEKLKEHIKRKEEGREQLERELHIAERTLDKHLKTTHAGLDMNAGRMIQRRRNRVKIDLQPLYQLVGDRTEDELDTALLEFFNKGIAGLLTKANKGYIGSNSMRQKVFLQLIHSLRTQFTATRSLDRYDRELDAHRSACDELLESLRNQSATPVTVHGEVAPDVEMWFVRAAVEEFDDGEVTINSERASLKVTANGSNPHVVRVGLKGESEELEPDRHDLSNVTLQLEEDQVVWTRI